MAASNVLGKVDLAACNIFAEEVLINRPDALLQQQVHQHFEVNRVGVEQRAADVEQDAFYLSLATSCSSSHIGDGLRLRPCRKSC